MTNRLRRLKITRIDRVDRGANADAEVLLFKGAHTKGQSMSLSRAIENAILARVDSRVSKNAEPVKRSLVFANVMCEDDAKIAYFAAGTPEARQYEAGEAIQKIAAIYGDEYAQAVERVLSS